jgi:Ca2+/H+ antiporter, TMEM165/GDT1 family
MNVWKELGPTVLASFLASFVEFVEALTIVLAVWTVRGARSALAGAAAGGVLLAILVFALGPLLRFVPLDTLRLVVGVLLLLFGMRWLRKAILRSAGILALHDESREFAEETASLAGSRASITLGIDLGGAGATFNAVVLEGLEVVFIVVALGATGGMLIPASLGAAAAGVVVILLGFIVHRPLARVPENSLKFVVGILISSFGVFWVGEGAGFDWVGRDLAIIGIAVIVLLAAVLTVPIARRIVDPVNRAGIPGVPQ